jgi:ABC-type phosphate transport system substrate-binding protein
MAVFTQHLTEWYHNNHADTSFTVAPSAPTKGIAALVEGRAEIASRQVLGGEILALRDRRSTKFVQIPVATEVVGILVHPSNPIHEPFYFRFAANFVWHGEELEAGGRV